MRGKHTSTWKGTNKGEFLSCRWLRHYKTFSKHFNHSFKSLDKCGNEHAPLCIIHLNIEMIKLMFLFPPKKKKIFREIIPLDLSVKEEELILITDNQGLLQRSFWLFLKHLWSSVLLLKKSIRLYITRNTLKYKSLWYNFLKITCKS